MRDLTGLCRGNCPLATGAERRRVSHGSSFECQCKKKSKKWHFPDCVFFCLHVSEDDGRAWNGSVDALLRMDKEDHGMGSRGGHSGIPVHFSGATSRAHSESLAGVDSSPGFRALPRVGLPLPCQTFPACRNGGRRTLGACNVPVHSSTLRSSTRKTSLFSLLCVFGGA